MTQPNRYEGLIFDFNGVLFWDDTIQRESWRAFATRLREKPLSDEEIDVHVHGRNGKHTMEYLLGTVISSEKAQELTEQKEIIYREMCLALGDGFALSPGAVGLLETLLAGQVPFTIATASGMKNVDFFAKHLNLGLWFDLAAIVYDDGKTPGKPAPDLYLRAAKRLGLTPESCVVIEDSQSGIQSAHDAGIGHIIALGPRSKHEWLAQLDGVDQVQESLEEVHPGSLFSGC